MGSKIEKGKKLIKNMQWSKLPPWATELNPAGDLWERGGGHGPHGCLIRRVRRLEDASPNFHQLLVEDYSLKGINSLFYPSRVK